MSAVASKPPTPRTFTTYTEVEVDIEPRELEQAGWVYVGTDDKGKGAVTSTDRLERLIADRHDDEHDGPIRWCQDVLCQEVARD